jgi:peptide/nickel transport system substrate-binding protein
VGNGDGSIVRINPRTDEVTARIDVGNDPEAIAVGAGGVWVADPQDNTVMRIDPASNAVTSSIPVAPGPSALTIAAGSVWVANTQADEVQRIDPSSGTVTANVPVARRPVGLAAAAGAVYVANSASGSVSVIDAITNRVRLTLKIGQQPSQLTVAGGRLWVSVQAGRNPGFRPTAAPGGTLRVALTADPGGGDPALFFADPGRAYATCALLENYPDRPFPQGAELQPEVAAAPPAVSDGGRAYTYTIRPGFRFSPPSNQPVTAAAFQRGIDRALSPKLHSYAASFMTDIVGVRAYRSGQAHRLSGVSSVGSRLVVRLTQPAPDLPARLATPWFCAVPPDTPITAGGVALTPSAGPYYVASYVPNKAIVVRRNPNYTGPRPHRVAEIDYTVGIAPAQAVHDVTTGQVDYYSNAILGSGIPSDSDAGLAARYGPSSSAGRTSHQRYFETPRLAVDSLIFNTTRSPFSNVRLRRAVNYALDRRALAREAFPSQTARPTAQSIPPGMPGYRETSIYPLGAPNLARARRLAGTTHARAILYTCNTATCSAAAQTVHDNLKAIGIDVTVHALPVTRLFDVETAPTKPFDLAVWTYSADYPDPSDFINLQFETGQSIFHLSAGRTLNHRMRAAALLTGTKRYRAYAELDHDLTAREALAAPYASGAAVELFSNRADCQLHQPIYGLDLGALCLSR